jgi:hypothetical protein
LKRSGGKEVTGHGYFGAEYFVISNIETHVCGWGLEKPLLQLLDISELGVGKIRPDTVDDPIRRGAFYQDRENLVETKFVLHHRIQET